MKCKICGNDMILGDLGWYCDKDEEHYENVMPLTEEQKDKLIEHRFKQVSDMRRQISDLQSQLAEKEKEIEYQENMKILAVDNQNKKAIEQLEKIINLFEPYENENKDTILCANNGISFLEYIDNQIASLKKGVE